MTPLNPTHPTDLLLVHPLARSAHVEHNPAYAALLASVSEIGIIEPLKVCRTDGKGDSPGYLYIVDGLERHRAAKEAMLSEVPILEVRQQDAASIILHSLVGRRHLTKGALAYLSLPVLESVLLESRARRLENLKNAKSVVSASKHRKWTESTIGTADDLAEVLGMDRTLLFDARKVRKFFSEYKGLRERWEPLLIAGEKSLGDVLREVTGKVAGLEGRSTPAPLEKAGELQLEFWKMAEHRLAKERWEVMAASERKDSLQAFSDKFLPTLPTEFHEAWAIFYKQKIRKS